jgi:exopolysaccharide biosynthesis polyprenyl glycosylphosphotransferase
MAACLVVGDVAVVLGAFLAAHWARFVAPLAESQALAFEQYVWLSAIVASITVALLGLHGLYDQERPRAWPVRLHLVTSSVSTALLLTITLSFFAGEQRFSRIWIAEGWSLAVCGLVVWRSAAQPLCIALRDRLAPADRVLIVGANPLGSQLARELAQRYRVVGYVDNGSDLETGLAGDGLSLLGPISRLDTVVEAHGVDEVIVALPSGRREQVGRMLARGFHRRVQVKIVPDIPDFVPAQFQVLHMAGRPYIGFASAARVSVIKRVIDLVAGGALVLALAPMMLALALLIKLDSPGPVFYRQWRVGKNGRLFRMVKFRSMYQDADRRLAELRAKNEASGPLFKMRADPRITRVGRVLRRFSVDEIPQLFNVLAGEMSLIGPRPPLPAEVQQYEDWQVGRLRAVPGMTGLWQVSGRSEVPFPDMVRLDLHYIRNWSLGMDVEILLRTIPAVLTSRGAY